MNRRQLLAGIAAAAIAPPSLATGRTLSPTLRAVCAAAAEAGEEMLVFHRRAMTARECAERWMPQISSINCMPSRWTERE